MLLALWSAGVVPGSLISKIVCFILGHPQIISLYIQVRPGHYIERPICARCERTIRLDR